MHRSLLVGSAGPRHEDLTLKHVADGAILLSNGPVCQLIMKGSLLDDLDAPINDQSAKFISVFCLSKEKKRAAAYPALCCRCLRNCLGWWWVARASVSSTGSSLKLPSFSIVHCLCLSSSSASRQRRRTSGLFFITKSSRARTVLFAHRSRSISSQFTHSFSYT